MTTNTIIESLNVEYRGADIAIELLSPAGANLKVNGILRDSYTGKTPCRFKLSTSVQTDYEWHEFIEAAIDFAEATLTVTIDANSTRIAEAEYPVEVDA